MASDLLGSMRVEIVGDNKKLDKSIKTSKKETEKFGKSTASLGKSLSGMFAGIGFAVVAKKLFDLGKAAENLFNVQKLAETKLDATLIATASAAGLTADELKKMATGLQEVTTFGDEAIIGAESLLLTFKDIGGDVFPRALESILDVSTAMGQDLKSSTVQLGKALNDPVGGIAALTRVGIQFTDSQKDLIKSFVEAGDVASAQGVILNELESQFGGVSKAVALTAEGVSKQLSNSFGDLLETIGGVISEAMTPYRESLRLEVESINDSITAHLIRKKAIAGTATAIEDLTLKQIEQDKTEKALAQALANIDAAENQVLDTRHLSEVQIGQINKEKEAAIRIAENTVSDLRDELVLRKLGTQAAEDAVIAEREQIESNILLAEGINSVTEAKTEDLAVTEEALEIERKAAEERAEILHKETEIFHSEIDSRAARLVVFQEEDRLASEERIEQARIEAQAKIDLAFSYFEAASGFLSAIDALSTANGDAELQRLEDEGASQETLDDKKRELARDGARRKKAIGLLDVGISTASAIIGMLANPGGLPGIVLSVLAGVTGGIQAAAIAATPLPSFAAGGVVPGGQFMGDRVPVMADSGEAIINRADQQSLMKFIQGGSNSGNSSNMRIIVNLDKKPILDAVANGAKNGTLVIDSRSVK